MQRILAMFVAIFFLFIFSDTVSAARIKRNFKPKTGNPKSKIIVPKKDLAPLNSQEKKPNGTLIMKNVKEKTFLNKSCKETDTCDLKSVYFRTLDYEVWIEGDPSYGSSVIARYTTESVADLEKYAFVHFMRGCVFSSRKMENGTVENSFGIEIVNFDKNQKFCFPDWVIDSQDTDPVYNSDPELGRHYLYRWAKMLGSYENRKIQEFYGIKVPSKPQLFVIDNPHRAFKVHDFAVNISMEYKMCLYKSSDVPRATNEKNVDFADPIACVEYSSNFVYNFETNKFERPVEINSFCLIKPVDFVRQF